MTYKDAKGVPKLPDGVASEDAIHEVRDGITTTYRRVRTDQMLPPQYEPPPKQPTVARGAPQTDTEMIAALEATIENYRIACDGFEHGAQVAAERIAALEAQIEAAHRAIDSIGLSRCADSHESRDANGCVTCDDGKPPLSLAERTEWLIRWLSDDPYPMWPRIKALEAENAALLDRISAEAGLRVDTEAERDTALDNLRAADKELRAKDELWHQNIAFTYEIMKQRDAARAWGAAWRSCAHWWFYVPRETDRYWFKDEFADQARQRRAARRAVEAAEAQERR